MTASIRFRPDAAAEIFEAVDWYESRAKGLGAEFLRSLDAGLAAIRRNPLACPVVLGTVRRAVLRRFPYTLIYNVSEDGILIVACIHGRRDPKRWQERV
jgi:plasmid stabilization system protein ParE